MITHPPGRVYLEVDATVVLGWMKCGMGTEATLAAQG